MDGQLSEEQLNELLPSLKRLAELISAGETLDRRMLHSITSEIGLEEWAVIELELWGRILEKARDSSNSKDKILAELRSRGIPEFSALLAYEVVNKPFSIEPPRVDFGRLKSGEGDNKTLIVRGGAINKVVVNSQRLKIIPQKMNDGTISVKVQLSAGASGESFHGEFILQGDRGELKVPVTAQWERSSEQPVLEQKELLLLLWCPNCQPRIKWKSLLYSKAAGKSRCSNCGHEFPYDDKRVKQVNKPLH